MARELCQKISHSLVKIFGGHYYEVETDSDNWYYGEINMWFSIKFFAIKRWLLLKKYSIQICWLKIKMRINIIIKVTNYMMKNYK